MGYIIVGILFILGGASGEYALKGTNSGGLLVLVGFAMVGFGIYRLSNPTIECRLCGASMSKGNFTAHLRDRHPEEAQMVQAKEAIEARAAEAHRASSQSFELVIHDPGPKRDKVVKVLMGSFSIDRPTAEAALTRPIQGGYATVEGARMAVEATGARAETRDRLNHPAGIGHPLSEQVQSKGFTGQSPPSSRRSPMQPSTTPPIPPYPQQVIAKNHWGWAIAALALALIVVVVGGLLYVSVRQDLDQARTQLEAAQSDVASADVDLRRTERTLSKVRRDLKSNNRTSRIIVGCVSRLLGSWYETLQLSYEATGLTLQRAVNSRACFIPRTAYQRTH